MFRGHFLSVIALSVALACVGVSCGGLCQRTAEEYQVRWRQEAAWVGSGISTLGASEYHFGITYSAAFLEALFVDVNDELPVWEDRITVEAERRSTIETVAQPRLTGLTLGDRETRTVQLEFDLDLMVIDRTPRNPSSFHLSGSFFVDGYLVLGTDEVARPTVDIVLTNLGCAWEEQDQGGGDSLLSTEEATVEASSDDQGETVAPCGVEVGFQALPETVADVIAPRIQTALANVLLNELGQITLIRYPPIRFGYQSIGFTASGIEISSEQQALFVGFVSYLRPSYGGMIEADFSVTEGGMRWLIHGDLPTAAIRLALFEGALPQDVDGEGQTLTDGPVHISLEQIQLGSESFELDFVTWDLRDGYCWAPRLRAAGEVRIRDNSIGLFLTDLSPLDAVDDYHLNYSALSVWRHSDFVTRGIDLIEDIINLDGVYTASGEMVPLVPQTLEVDEGRITVDYLMEAR